MVVRIRQGSSIRGAISYNERKMGKGDAELILASGFSCDVNELGFSEKLKRFQVLMERNRKVKINTLHISLNFSPEDKLTINKMQLIALDYMKQIGFAYQPFLIYEHRDTKHPHVHIVTTNIRDDNSYIDLHNIARIKSEPARKSIEIKFGITKAENRGKQLIEPISAIDLLPAQYGKEETKHTITNLVGEVVRTYRFSSLEELNLILKEMNIVADRGNPNSRMFQTGGLVFTLLNKNGFRTGQSIKSSEIYSGTKSGLGLKYLNRKFQVNEVRKIPLKSFTERTVKSAIKYGKSEEDFVARLSKRNISFHLEKDPIGILKAAHFIDHKNRTVFTNSDLDVTLSDIYRVRQLSTKGRNTSNTSLGLTNDGNSRKDSKAAIRTHLTILGNLLLSGQTMSDPDDSKLRRKKKKRKGPSL